MSEIYRKHVEKQQKIKQFVFKDNKVKMSPAQRLKAYNEVINRCLIASSDNFIKKKYRSYLEK